MEKLHIQGFAGMGDVELDIGRFNVFIGPQAAGKSVCAKLLYYFKNFLHTGIAEGFDIPQSALDDRFMNLFERYFPHESWPTDAFKIGYRIQDFHVEIEHPGAGSHQLKLTYSKYAKQALQQTRERYQKVMQQFAATEDELQILEAEMQIAEALRTRFKKELGNESVRRQVFVPAGRSFFATLESNVFSLLSKQESLDPFLVAFGSFYELAKSRLLFNRRIASMTRKDLETVRMLITQILCGKHVRRGRKDYLQLNDGRTVAISNSSSGQQEMLPLAVVLQHLATRSYKTGAAVYIEEPEAHLFPSAQRAIVQLIATVFNIAPSDLQFVLTTHSPYLLTSFNNLLQAGQIAQSKKRGAKKLVYEIVPEEQVLHAMDFRCYMLENGSAESLMDAESGLIKADAIDNASDILAAQFYKLMEVADQ